MIDLKTMIDAMPLQECKAEIERQFNALAGHGDEMKLVILMMLLLKSSLDTIKAIDPNKFLESLQTELQREIEEAEKWQLQNHMYREHLEKNQELVTLFETRTSEVRQLCSELNNRLSEFDSILKDLAVDRCRKSIAEIESERARE